MAPRLSGPTSTRSIPRGSSALLERGRRRRALGEEEGDGVVLQPTRGERERHRRRDGRATGCRRSATSSGSPAASARSAFRNPMAIAPASGGAPDGHGSQERHLQGVDAAARAAPASSSRLDAVEQVDQRREREPGLGVARPCREDAQSRARAPPRHRPPRASSCRCPARPRGRGHAAPGPRPRTRAAPPAPARGRQSARWARQPAPLYPPTARPPTVAQKPPVSQMSAERAVREDDRDGVAHAGRRGRHPQIASRRVSPQRATAAGKPFG